MNGDWQTSIVVEDGTGTLNANSYISCADARAYNVNRGLPFPPIGVTDDDTNDALAQAALFRAMDYIESLPNAQAWIGYKAVPLTQKLSWPRVYVDPLGQFPYTLGYNWDYINGYDNIIPGAFSVDTVTGVPAAMAMAQARLASMIGSGNFIDFYPVITGPVIIEEEIGPLKTTYNPLYGVTGRPRAYEIDDLLNPYLNNNGAPAFTAGRA